MKSSGWMAGMVRHEEGLQPAGLPEREPLRPASAAGRVGRLAAGQSGSRQGLSGGLAGDPQAGPGRGATLPPLWCLGERRRPHAARLTRGNA